MVRTGTLQHSVIAEKGYESDPPRVAHIGEDSPHARDHQREQPDRREENDDADSEVKCLPAVGLCQYRYHAVSYVFVAYVFVAAGHAVWAAVEEGIRGWAWPSNHIPVSAASWLGRMPLTLRRGVGVSGRESREKLLQRGDLWTLILAITECEHRHENNR